VEGCASRALAELQWGREGGKEEGEERERDDEREREMMRETQIGIGRQE